MCTHKFIHDLQLEYVNWEVNTLFIGTFNPGCCDEEDNEATWFYGRTQNNMFWDTLGYIYENNPLLGQQGNPEVWLAFCKRNKLAVTDLISEINNVNLNGQDYEDLCNGFSDARLEPYILNGQAISTEIENLINNSRKLKNLKCVYFTRRTTNGTWNILWNPIHQICNQKGVHLARLTTPGGNGRFQFNSNFLRTPENLAILWADNGFSKCNK
jgi:hypothetical protein